jgi:translation initiation factor 1
MAKKLTGGEGWRVIPAEPAPVSREVVSKPAEQQKARISVEKRKKGKTVTVISGLVLTDDDLKALAKLLKTSCGTGGTVGNAEIELQGDCREKARDWLKANNWGLR